MFTLVNTINQIPNSHETSLIGKEEFPDKCFQVVFGGHFSDARLCKLITCFSFQQLQSRFKSLPFGSPKFF